MQRYKIFHTTEPGRKIYFLTYKRHGWAFEPVNFEGVMYSLVYATRETAEKAARSIFF